MSVAHMAWHAPVNTKQNKVAGGRMMQAAQRDAKQAWGARSDAEGKEGDVQRPALLVLTEIENVQWVAWIA